MWFVRKEGKWGGGGEGWGVGWGETGTGKSLRTHLSKLPFSNLPFTIVHTNITDRKKSGPVCNHYRENLVSLQSPGEGGVP